MTTLEARYRAALRFYPLSWRIKNEEAVMGTLLDTAEGEGREAPRPFELANLTAHGILQRLRLVPTVVPSSVRDRASTAALAIGAAIALAATMQLESYPNRWDEFFPGEYATFGPFASPAIVVYAVWGVAFFASVAGFTTVTRWLALATIPLSFIAREVADASEMILRPTWSFLGLLVLLASLVAAGRPTSDRANLRWLLGWFLPAAIVFTLPQTLINRGGFAFQEPLWLGRPELISWAPVIAVVLALVFQFAGKPAWAAAIVLLGIPFTAAALLGTRGVSLQVAWLALVGAGIALTTVLVLRLFGIQVRVVRVPRRAGAGFIPWRQS